MDIRLFFKDRKLLSQSLLIVASLILLVGVTMFSLKLYTHHGKSISVPDFGGYKEHQVASLCKKSHLRYVIVDSVFVAEAVPGAVIDQYPQIGYKVKRNRKIFLTIAAMSPEMVKVPSLVDVSLREALNRLQNAGLVQGQITYRPSEFFNLVLEQRHDGLLVMPEALLVKGSSIDLVVGMGLSGERVQVPDLVGMEIESAKLMLYQVGLNVGALVEDDSFSEENTYIVPKVYKQKPVSDSRSYIEMGTSVDIWITKDSTRFIIDSNEEIIEENADSTGGF
jgi:eukaryotic-like serine/threonine-protein kinase